MMRLPVNSLHLRTIALFLVVFLAFPLWATPLGYNDDAVVPRQPGIDFQPTPTYQPLQKRGFAGLAIPFARLLGGIGRKCAFSQTVSHT